MGSKGLVGASGTASAAAALGLPRAAKAAPKAAVRETTVIRTAKGITVRCTLSPSGRGQGEGCENPPVIPFAVLSRQPELHHGWPTLARCQSGRLLLVYSGGREAQVCPFGRVEFVQSDDCGRNCTWPRVLLDTAIDDRDSGVLETSKGSILVTILTSSAYESILEQAEKNPVPEKAAWPLVPERIEHARTAHRRLTPAQRKAALGMWMIRSCTFLMITLWLSSLACGQTTQQSPFLSTFAAAGGDRLLSSFEKGEDVSGWSGGAVVAQQASAGSAAYLAPAGGKAELKLNADWSPYRHVKFDVYNPGAVVSMNVRVSDATGRNIVAWEYSVYHGRTTQHVRIDGLRNGFTLGEGIDTSRIARLEISFGQRYKGDSCREGLSIDNVASPPIQPNRTPTPRMWRRESQAAFACPSSPASRPATTPGPSTRPPTSCSHCRARDVTGRAAPWNSSPSTSTRSSSGIVPGGSIVPGRMSSAIG